MATMRQLKTGLRRRMGEPTGGTWGKYQYEEDHENQLTDELLEAINEAQVIVARDIYTPESYLFIRYDVEIPVVAGSDIYTLPEDFVAVEELRYVRRAQNYPMKRRSIKHVRYFNDRQISGGVLQYYDYQGLINTYLVEGSVDETSPNILNDARADFAGVRIGDIVYNITDDSEGFVTAFRSGRIEVEGLQGGRANIFTRGDTYAVATAEENRWALQTYPRITTTDTVLYDGDADAIRLSAADVVTNFGISAQITEIPDDLEDDEVINFVIYEGDSIYNNPLGPAEFARDQVRSGYNVLARPESRTEFGLRYDFNVQFAQNTTYSIRAFREDSTKDELTVAKVRLITRTEDKMLLTYARQPRRMKTDDSICEFPNEFNEAIYKRAKVILHEKLNPEGVAPQLYDEYNYEVLNLSTWLASRDESGPMQIDTDGEPRDYHRGNAQWTPYFR